MKSFIPLNLEEYFNHKIVYSKLPNGDIGEEFGLDNICILESDIKLNEKDILDGVEFNFVFNQFDNIVCNRQKILIDSEATKIHIVGFAYRGDVNEYFKIVYSDMSEELMSVPFIDWAHKPNKAVMNSEELYRQISTTRAVISSGEQIHLIYFHHITCDVKEKKKIKEIVMPDNMFTHIFAITLERETLECGK